VGSPSWSPSHEVVCPGKILHGASNGGSVLAEEADDIVIIH
jgi:hypothetical protein